MKTILTYYRYDTSNPDELEQYNSLVEQLKITNGKCINVIANTRTVSKSGIFEVELDTNHIFNNQWNTVGTDTSKGLRIFDWYEAIQPNKQLKLGHYLQITKEMVAVRKNTFACGYCGKQTRLRLGKSILDKFCPHCIDSEYLTRGLLHLLRLQTVANTKDRPLLSPEEEAVLLPVYTQAQLFGNASRNGKKITELRKKLILERDNAIHNATIKYNGFTWLLDNGINTDNCIYYSHTCRFCFGWRQPVDISYKQELLNVLANFPYTYDVK